MAGTQVGRIDRIELENFKSYGGRQTIGPFGDFSAVIGPNGSGKSNLMDAISFVVGLQSKELRGKQLRDLVYRGSSDAGDEERSAFVALIYTNDGHETVFKRSISVQGTGEYRVDGKAIKQESYCRRLQALGINTKAHTGFLVFQGYVSELAAKSPHELTALFEQISGSDDLKETYERLEREKRRAEEEQIYSYQKKKGLAQERNNMRKQKEEAERYVGLLEQRRELEQRLYLLRLFSIEKGVMALETCLAATKQGSESGLTRQAEVETSVQADEKEKFRLARRIVELERKAVSLQQQLENRAPDAIRVKEEIAHIQRRRKMSEKTLDKVSAQQEKMTRQLSVLHAELGEFKKAIEKLESEHAATEDKGRRRRRPVPRGQANLILARNSARSTTD